MFQLVLIVLVSTTCWWTAASGLNITLNLTQLNSSQGSENVVIGSDVYVFCLNEQDSYSVYVTEDQSKAENCETTPSNSYILIGSCQNSPLTIRILTTSISFGDIQSYEVGSQYYFTVFVNNGLSITSNQPCLDGYKFSFSVVAAPVETPVSSSSVMSSVFSSANRINPMVSEVTTSFSSTSDNGAGRPGISTTTGTIDPRQMTSMSTDGKVYRTPTIGHGTGSDKSVATYAGIGTGAFVFVITVIVMVVLLVVAAIIILKKKRGRNKLNSIFPT